MADQSIDPELASVFRELTDIRRQKPTARAVEFCIITPARGKPESAPVGAALRLARNVVALWLPALHQRKEDFGRCQWPFGQCLPPQASASEKIGAKPGGGTAVQELP